VGNTVFN